jgi:hypothetical protein
MLRLRRVKEKCPSTSPEILLSVNARVWPDYVCLSKGIVAAFLADAGWVFY